MTWSQTLFPAVVRDIGVPLLIVSPTGRVHFANEAAQALVGRGDLTGVGVVALFAESDRATLAAFLDSLDHAGDGRSRELGPLELARGATRVVNVIGSVIHDVPGFQGVVLALHDVTDFVTREEELAQAAYSDGLTGLANRSLALRHLAAACSPTAIGSVLVIDIDGFADLNNILGQPEGDRILVALARRLTRSVPGSSVVARLSGDEFLVLMPRTPLAHAEDFAQELLGMLSLPVDVAGTAAQVSASIGIASLASASADDVLTRAYGALYVSKSHGPGGVVCDGPAVRERNLRRSDLMAQVSQLRTEAERARQEARTDAGTGLPNRRRFDEDTARMQERATRTGTAVGVVFIDLDRFGLLNKRRGDEAGDLALGQVAAILASQSRAGDTFYRKGGEEFVGLLADTDLRGALLVAERLRSTIASAGIPHGGHPECPHLTVSIGVASGLTAETTVEELIVTAGHEMLRAKQRGRNQVSPRQDLHPHRGDRPIEPDDDDVA